jgi:hypothetical protein
MVLIVLRRRDSPSLLWRACGREVAFGALLIALLIAGFSCGGGSSGVSPPPSESGTVTVQGTGPTTSHSVAISVTVD